MSLDNNDGGLEPLLEHRDWALQLSRSLDSDAHGAEDLVQDAFVRALESSPEQRRAVGRAWLGRVLRNRGIDVQRKRGRVGASVVDVQELPEAAHEGLEQLVREESLAAVGQAIAELDESYRTLVELRYGRDLTAQAISQKLGLRPSTVRGRLGKAHELLREKLKGRLDPRAFSVLLWLNPNLEAAASGAGPAGIRQRIASRTGFGLAAAAGVVAVTVLREPSGQNEGRHGVPPLEEAQARPIGPGEALASLRSISVSEGLALALEAVALQVELATPDGSTPAGASLVLNSGTRVPLTPAPESGPGFVRSAAVSWEAWVSSEFKFQLEVPGYQTVPREALVQPGSLRAAPVGLVPAGSLTGRLIWPPGFRAQDFELFALEASAKGSPRNRPSHRPTSDVKAIDWRIEPDGVFRMDNLPAGELELMIQLAGWHGFGGLLVEPVSVPIGSEVNLGPLDLNSAFTSEAGVWRWEDGLVVGDGVLVARSKHAGAMKMPVREGLGIVPLGWSDFYFLGEASPKAPFGRSSQMMNGPSDEQPLRRAKAQQVHVGAPGALELGCTLRCVAQPRTFSASNLPVDPVPVSSEFELPCLAGLPYEVELKAPGHKAQRFQVAGVPGERIHLELVALENVPVQFELPSSLGAQTLLARPRFAAEQSPRPFALAPATSAGRFEFDAQVSQEGPWWIEARTGFGAFAIFGPFEASTQREPLTLSWPACGDLEVRFPPVDTIDQPVFLLEGPAGVRIEATLDADGVARIENVPAGEWSWSFRAFAPELPRPYLEATDTRPALRLEAPIHVLPGQLTVWSPPLESCALEPVLLTLETGAEEASSLRAVRLPDPDFTILHGGKRPLLDGLTGSPIEVERPAESLKGVKCKLGGLEIKLRRTASLHAWTVELDAELRLIWDTSAFEFLDERGGLFELRTLDGFGSAVSARVPVGLEDPIHWPAGEAELWWTLEDNELLIDASFCSGEARTEWVVAVSR